MHSLAQINRMNNKAAAKVEDNHNRNCSFSQDSDGHIVLHSAKHRNTVYLGPKAAKHFLKRLAPIADQGANQISINALIESYFNPRYSI